MKEAWPRDPRYADSPLRWMVQLILKFLSLPGLAWVGFWQRFPVARQRIQNPRWFVDLIDWFVTHWPDFWYWVQACPCRSQWVNRIFLGALTSRPMPRPYPLSLWGPDHSPQAHSADYVSWTGLVDRRYTSRHLEPAPDYTSGLRDIKEVMELFKIRDRSDSFVPSRSSILFGFFAQWFTDSFLRTDPLDVRKNTSNHNIDLCQIYGLTAADTRILRSGSGGLLKSQQLADGEYPPLLFNRGGKTVKDEFLGLSYIDRSSRHFRNPVTPDLKLTCKNYARFFATGLERGNSSIFYGAINTLFLREHNRLCRMLGAHHKDWDDDRLFETARNINIVQLLKIVIGDYINHISPAHFRLSFELGWAEDQPWYRTNQISAEFNLLYRWHQLIPETINVGGVPCGSQKFRFNNRLLMRTGLTTVIADAARQKAGRIGLHNTAPFLEKADEAALLKSRAWELASFNDYCAYFGLPQPRSFEELVGDRQPGLADELGRLYHDVSQVELPVGLLAQAQGPREILGALMNAMVAADALTHALTNPLLSKNIYGPAAFTAEGLDSIDSIHTLDDLFQRNTLDGGQHRATFAWRDAVDRPADTAREVPSGCDVFLLTPLAHSLAFWRCPGWKQFLESRRERFQSSVFKANIFFTPVVALLDEKAISVLFQSKHLVQDHGFGWAHPPLELTGGVKPSIFAAMGPGHDDYKMFYAKLLQDRSRRLTSVMARICDETFSEWQQKQSFSLSDALEDFSARFVYRWMLGITPDTAAVRLVYQNIFSHPLRCLTRWWPCSTLARSVKYHDALHRQILLSPEFARDGMPLAPGSNQSEVASQLQFVMGVNMFLAFQNLLRSVMAELGLHRPLQKALRRDIQALLNGRGASELTLKDLGDVRLNGLDHTIKEVLRLHPPVLTVFGRATQPMTLDSDSGQFSIAQGELLMGVLAIAQMDPRFFPDPTAFDPARFDDPQAVQHLIWSRGVQVGSPADRSCPGSDIAQTLAKLFCIHLLSNWDWHFADGQPEWSPVYTLNCSAPTGPLSIDRFDPVP